jgi:pilin isopeptide linkage protein/LPXTG-motif cell wall-anchored protein
MPNGASGKSVVMTVKAGETEEFGEIIFRAPGEYYYQVTELNTKKKGYTYDSAVYTLHYTLSLNDEGELVMDRITYKNGKNLGHDVSEFEFVNKYTPPEGPDTGDHNKLAGMLGIFGSSALGLIYMFFRRRREEF